MTPEAPYEIRRLLLSERQRELSGKLDSMASCCNLLRRLPALASCSDIQDYLAHIHDCAEQLREQVVGRFSEATWLAGATDAGRLRSEGDQLYLAAGNTLQIALINCDYLQGDLEKDSSLHPLCEYIAVIRERQEAFRYQLRSLLDELILPETQPARDAVATETNHSFNVRVLIADDEVHVCQSLRAHLDGLNFSFTDAYSGRQAIERLRNSAIDLVLLDNFGGPVSAEEVLTYIRSQESLRDIPVLMISGISEARAMVRYHRVGADDYLQKPISRDAVRTRVSAYLERKRLRDQIRKERFKNILIDILPEFVIDQLSSGQSVRPLKHSGVAVLFADIAGFTQYCATRSPDEVVDQLGDLFKQWDHISLDNGIQKIKTIGDAFMAACGIQRPAPPNPVLNCVRCGLEMIAATRAHARRVGAPWDLRVGVHVGEVVAGILGQRQYLYDMWGNDVNIAQRMEGHGRTGHVNLSDAAYRTVASVFPYAPHTRGPVKGLEGDSLVYHISPPTSSNVQLDRPVLSTSRPASL